MGQIHHLLKERQDRIIDLDKKMVHVRKNRKDIHDIDCALAKEFYGDRVYNLMTSMLEFVQRFGTAEVTFPDTPEGKNDWCNYVSDCGKLEEYLYDFLSGENIAVHIAKIKDKLKPSTP